MSSAVATLKVVFEDDNTGQEILVYSGQTILASCKHHVCKVGLDILSMWN